MTDSLMVRVRVLLAALVLGAVFLGTYAAKAHAYDHWIIRNLKTGNCLADMGEPAGASTTTRTNSAPQRRRDPHRLVS